jgi:hypothetical protein
MPREGSSLTRAARQIGNRAGRLGRLATRSFRAGGKIGVELVYPPRCAFCEDEIIGPTDGILLCTLCRRQLTESVHAVCPRCATSIEGRPGASVECCPNCRGEGWQLSASFRLGIYRDELREASYGRRIRPASRLRRLLENRLPNRAARR